MKWAYTDDDIIMLFLRAKKQQKQIIVLANLCGVSKRTIMRKLYQLNYCFETYSVCLARPLKSSITSKSNLLSSSM